MKLIKMAKTKMEKAKRIQWKYRFGLEFGLTGQGSDREGIAMARRRGNRGGGRLTIWPNRCAEG
jgi:hypothetical protein